MKFWLRKMTMWKTLNTWIFLGLLYSQIAKASDALFFSLTPCYWHTETLDWFLYYSRRIHFFSPRAQCSSEIWPDHVLCSGFVFTVMLWLNIQRTRAILRTCTCPLPSFVKWFWISNQISQTWCTPDRCNALQSK